MEDKLAQILIIDDHPSSVGVLAAMVEKMGYAADTAETLKSGITKSQGNEFDLILLDINLPDGNGLDALPTLRNAPGKPEVIIITGTGNPNSATLAFESEAWDYVEKPVSYNNLALTLNRALTYRSEKKANKKPILLKRSEIIGESPLIESCLEMVSQAAIADAAVLISGETGTGKELFARAIHENSPRASGDFVVIDCASLPETLVESLLFGFKRGAFTGAEKPHKGLIEQADGGTLFLDEVGELPLNVQKSFLRVLQEKNFRPVGGQNEIHSDFRLVAATNRNLDEMAEKGEFRNDLLYRLISITITIPPLRDRAGDLDLLVQYWMNRLCKRLNIESKGYSPDFIEIMKEYDWPGNVRELINTLERALLTSAHDPTMYAKHLPAQMKVNAAFQEEKKSPVGLDADFLNPDNIMSVSLTEQLPSLAEYRKTFTEKIEQDYLTILMQKCDNNIKMACEMSDLSQARLYALLKKYEINRH